MQTLKIQKLAFNTHIYPWEVPEFYAAWRRLSGEVATPKNYPLVQCKTRWANGRQQPLVVVIEERQPDWYESIIRCNKTIPLHERNLPLQVAHAAANTFLLRQTKDKQAYRLFNFQPFDQQHYRRYRSLTTTQAKQELLKECLVRHITHFTEGVDWSPTDAIEVSIAYCYKEKLITYMGEKMHCFDLSFLTNIFLPEYIGLGKGVNKGFGVVRRIKKGPGNPPGTS